MVQSSIDLCICTYERKSIEQTLASIADMDFDLSTVRIVVADNAVTAERRSWIESLGDRFGLRLTYVHAPSRNISIARNACLDACTAPLVAFIDDDETVSRGWLKELVTALDSPSVDCAFGPVKAIFPAATPEWLRDGSLHDAMLNIDRQGVIRTGYTCNAIMRRASVGGRRFDVELGRAGGEDSVFFLEMFKQGRRFAFASEAVAFEHVPPSRLEFSWLMRRYFRNGQTHGRLIRLQGQVLPLAAASAAAKVAACLMLALVNIFSEARRSRALIRASMHSGVFFSIIGLREITIY